MAPVRPLLCAVAALLAAHAQFGCQPRSGSTTSPSVQSSGGGGTNVANNSGRPSTASANAAWPYWPATMRVHPLTRLTTDNLTAQSIIECRLEFQDLDGQTSRAVGQLTLQLYPDSFAATGSGAIETWNQDLRDLITNRRQYDDVTRTYLFRLQLTHAPPAGCEVRAFFLSENGQRLSATMRLRQ